jgi:hypothetical protein
MARGALDTPKPNSKPAKQGTYHIISAVSYFTGKANLKSLFTFPKSRATAARGLELLLAVH